MWIIDTIGDWVSLAFLVLAHVMVPGAEGSLDRFGGTLLFVSSTPLLVAAYLLFHRKRLGWSRARLAAAVWALVYSSVFYYVLNPAMIGSNLVEDLAKLLYSI